MLALAELCREREDELQHAPRSASPAPRSLSSSRGTNPTPVHNHAFRSHSQAPFDRLAPAPHIETPHARKGRQSEGDMPDYSAQELWLASQGTNLGGVGGLGLGFTEHGFDVHNARGRDPGTRGLETPDSYREQRRSTSTYEGGSGSISAPLSPHRLYAQLDLSRGPQNWPAYDPRLHASPGMPVDRVSGPSSYRNSTSASQRTSRSGSLIPTNGGHLGEVDPSPPLPAFAPFLPNHIASNLRPLNGEPASYISPSTLLSPAQDPPSLPATSVNSLAQGFGRMGVSPPGKGTENPAEARRAETQSSRSHPTSPTKGSR